MKKYFAALLALIMIFVFSACSGAKQGTESDDSIFIVGFDAEFPPYGYINENGDYVGFDLDLAAEVCARNGWELVKQPIDWNSKDLELGSGSIDCIWNGFTMNEREELYTWTSAYMDNSQVFLCRAADNMTQFSDLAGKTVMVQADSAAQGVLESEDYADLSASFKQTIVCADYTTAFLELDAGSVDAIAIDVGVANYLIEGRENEFVIMDEKLNAEQYGVGFKLGNTELRDKVETTLREMAADGTFAKISEKWFGYDVCILGD